MSSWTRTRWSVLAKPPEIIVQQGAEDSELQDSEVAAEVGNLVRRQGDPVPGDGFQQGSHAQSPCWRIAGRRWRESSSPHRHTDRCFPGKASGQSPHGYEAWEKPLVSVNPPPPKDSRQSVLHLRRAGNATYNSIHRLSIRRRSLSWAAIRPDGRTNNERYPPALRRASGDRSVS
jgi:hypothetical protein